MEGNQNKEGERIRVPLQTVIRQAFSPRNRLRCSLKGNTSTSSDDEYDDCASSHDDYTDNADEDDAHCGNTSTSSDVDDIFLFIKRWRVQKATNRRYSQTSQVIAMMMVVMVTMVMVMVMVVVVTMMTMTLVVWESSKCIAHMNHSLLSATLSFYDYSGHSASDRINYFERKILVTHKYIHTHL